MTTRSVLLRSVATVCAIVGGWIVGHRVFVAPPPPTPATSTVKPLVPDPPSPSLSGATVSPPAVPPESERLARFREGRELAARWPASREAARQRAFSLAAHDPLGALTLLQSLLGPSFEGVTSWEREIVLTWARRDLAGVFAGLDAVCREDGRAPEHWISIIASVVQHEHRDGLGAMLRWIRDTERAGANGLALLATNKLVTHLTRETADAVSAHLIERANVPAYRDALVQLANTYAHQAPEKALNRIQTLPDVALRRDALLAVVSAVTWDEPTRVLEWLNSGTLLVTAGLVELSDPEATQVRDEILTAYFTSLVSSNPGYVSQYAQAVVDPASRRYLLQMAELSSRTERLSPPELALRDGRRAPGQPTEDRPPPP